MVYGFKNRWIGMYCMSYVVCIYFCVLLYVGMRDATGKRDVVGLPGANAQQKKLAQRIHIKDVILTTSYPREHKQDNIISLSFVYNKNDSNIVRTINNKWYCLYFA